MKFILSLFIISLFCSCQDVVKLSRKSTVDALTSRSFTAPSILVDTPSIITLQYTAPNGGRADTCSVSSLNNLTVITPCACSGSGVCTVEVEPTSGYTGLVSFDYVVALGGETSNTSTVSFQVTLPPPITANITPSSPYETVESIITLSYTVADSAQATACAVSSLNLVTVSTPCSCSGGVCTVGMTGTASGSGSFRYTVTANGIVSNQSLASFTILGAPTPFISRWDTTRLSAGSSANNQVKLPARSSSGYDYDFVVDWGDGSTDSFTSIPVSDAARTHTYATPGVYTITISGEFPEIYFGSSDDSLKILEITQWGNKIWNSLIFFNCEDLVISATDMPTFAPDTKLSFQWATNFNSPIGHWDTTNVTDLSYAFQFVTAFNQPLAGWNTENVTNMDSMFDNARAFNRPIGNWDTSKVANMAAMFRNAQAFDQPLAWNTSSVTNMSTMFQATKFNQDISGWNTGNVTAMNGMFNQNHFFNQPIGNWDTTKVVRMSSMFDDATAFNQNINWSIPALREATDFFKGATSFNGTFGASFVVTGIPNVGGQNANGWFNGATSFNQDLSHWVFTNPGSITNFSTGTTSWVLPKPPGVP